MFCILYLIVCLVTTGASSDGTVVGQLSKTNAQSGLEWFDVTSSANGATSVVVRRTDTYSSDLYISNQLIPHHKMLHTILWNVVLTVHIYMHLRCQLVSTTPMIMARHGRMHLQLVYLLNNYT